MTTKKTTKGKGSNLTNELRSKGGKAAMKKKGYASKLAKKSWEKRKIVSIEA